MTNRVSEVSAEALPTARRAIEVRDDSVAMTAAIEELKNAVIRSVRTSTTDVDRRTSPRYPTDLACRVSAPDQIAHAARVADLSLGGASIHGGPLLTIGTRGMLELSGTGVTLPFTVRSPSDGAMRVAFTLDAATEGAFLPVLQRLTRGIAA